MQIHALGHVVLKVADLNRSEQFYQRVLGLEPCARYDENGMQMLFYSLGNHHDLALMATPGGAPAADNSAGLHHVAFCIGNDLAQLSAAKAELDALAIAADPVDHDVTKSLYFDDPDGNTLEVYVDVSDGWREDPQRVAKAEPMTL